MRVIIQRVSEANVKVDGAIVGAIQAGLLVLLGIHNEDTLEDIQWISNKLVQMRIFDDADGVMNQSVQEIGGSILLISQFTLYGDTNAGRRPTWTAAAKPEYAEPLVNQVVTELQQLGAHVETGRFRTYMQVTSVNDGPTTVSIEL